MTDFLCPTCGPIDEDDGLLTGPGDAVCCAFCGCPEEDMTPLREAYDALVREMSPNTAAVPDFGPLVAPSPQAIEVFQKVLENKPDADMRAVPNQWLLNERATLEKIVNDMETAPVAVPKGYALVPETPTFEMYEAGEHALFGAVSTMNSGSCYIAMLRAAPAAPDVDDQQAALDTPEYSQGVCEDGAAILKDGQMMTIEEILAELKAAGRKRGLDVDEQQAALFRAHNGAED